MNSSDQMKGALKHYWGYDAFRPKQHEIVGNILDGRDVCVVIIRAEGR